MQNIALQITLGGIPQAVSSLDDLENAIRDARNELQGVEIGSDKFKQLSSEIKNAESSLKNFKKQSEGKDIEATLGDIGKLGGAIGASFAGATAAIALFGKESEDVTKAVAQAQNLLTIALAARAAGEGLVVVRTIASTIATKAATAATNASNAATKALYATLAANPYGAIVAAVGLLVTAVVLLTNKQSEQEIQAEKTAEAQEKYAEAVKTAGLNARVTATQVGFLVNEIKNGNIAIEDAAPLLGKFVAGLKNIDLATQEGQTTLNNYVTNLANLATITDQISAKTAELAEAEKAGNTARARAIRDELYQFSITAARYQKAVQDAEDADAKITEERERRIENSKRRQEKRIQDLINANLAQIRANNQVAGSNLKIIETEVDLIEVLEEKLTILESFSAQLDITRGLQEDFADVLKATTPEVDTFGNVFDALQVAAEEYYYEISRGKKTSEEAAEALREFRQDAIINADEIFSPQKQQQLAEYTDKYSAIFEVLGKLKGADLPVDYFKQFEKALIDLSLLEGTITVDPFERTPEEIATARQNADDFLTKTRDLFINAFQQINEDANVLRQLNETEQAAYLKGIQEQGAVTFDNLIKSGQEILVLEQDVNVAFKTIQNLNSELVKTGELAKQGFILANRQILAGLYEIDFTNIEASRERLVALEKEIALRRFDIQGEYATDVEFLEYQLAQKIPGFAQLSYEAKLIILQEYLRKEVEATEEAEKTKQDKIQETVNFIQDTIGQIQAALGALQQNSSDIFNLAFDNLEKRYERIQETIVGDTEEANQKRLEAEKAYNEEKKRLEKAAAKTALRFSLAQSIANSAQAITSALTAGPVIGQILAGITAAATVTQIGIINAQIAAIDSYKKGGMLRQMGTGGLVKGPAHEYGGVKYQRGGIELEGNESIINRVSTVRYQDLLNQINLSGGGAPIVNNFDDSRIVEAIATQRREPIRAYVVESDITNKQTIQRRLELLSSI